MNDEEHSVNVVLIDVEQIASNKECIVGGEDADVSIMRTNEIAKGTTLEARQT